MRTAIFSVSPSLPPFKIPDAGSSSVGRSVGGMMQPANNGVCKVPKGGKREEEGRRRERGEKLTRPGESGRTRRRKGKMAKWHWTMRGRRERRTRTDIDIHRKRTLTWTHPFRCSSCCRIHSPVHSFTAGAFRASIAAAAAAVAFDVPCCISWSLVKVNQLQV